MDIDTIELNALLQIARDTDNTLALDLWEAFKNESETFDEGYQAGWDDAIMKASILLDELDMYK